MSIVISVENLSKIYRLGQIGTGTFADDLAVWWAKIRRKPNPLMRIGQKNHGNRDGENVWALKDVSFTVGQGEVLGIIGRNGAGKSTLLKILSRVTAPTSGKIKVKGRIASLLEVGTGFHPDLTGRENIYLNGAILGMSSKEIDRKFDEIVGFSEVEKFIDTPVKRYSSGMYVRLAFAVAAHLEPEILIVDEVLAVGDVEFQKKCLNKMGDVAHAGRTVLFVSHNMNAINTLCPKCAWINNGKLAALGETPRVVHDYMFSQQASTSGAMNFQDWPDRYGDGFAKLISAKLIDQNGSASTQFFRTKPFSVELEIQSFTNNSLTLSLVVVNEIGVNVLHLAHFDSPIPMVVNRKGAYRVVITMPSLPLFTGSYNLVFGVHTGAQMMPADVVKNILPFSVDEPMDSPRPIGMPSDLFLCWAPSSWICESLDKVP